MLQLLKRCLGCFHGDLKTSERDKKDIYDPELYPVYPPATPSDIIANRAAYRTKLQKLRYAAPPGETADRPLYALYRLYEWFLLDYVTAYRDELEHFWRQNDWRICDLPDPKDPDPARYAFLAGVTDLLVRSFNRKIDYGASRSAPAIMTEQYADDLMAIPKEKRPWEERPSWADTVPELQDVLSIPTHDNKMLTGHEDPKADPYFKTKNIILWTPHIHFT